eukprot:5352456-Prorocentrum_lima.AAC.1
MEPSANFQFIDLHVPAVIRALHPNAGAGTDIAKILRDRPPQAATTGAPLQTIAPLNISFA